MEVNPTKWIVIGIVIIALFFAGEPDLMDAIISRIQGLPVVTESIEQFDETPDEDKF